MSTTTQLISLYLPLLLFTLGALGLCIFMLVGGWLLGGRARARYKNTPFESGIAATGSAQIQFSAKFYLVAIFFVIFDVEALYLYAWSVSIIEGGWIAFTEVTIFIVILLAGLVYLVRTGALNWAPKQRDQHETNATTHFLIQR